MNLIVFASFIIFVLWLTVNLKKTEKTNQQIEEEFWERETKANSVRKKSQDHLPYITFDFDALPTADSFLESGAQIPESLEILQNLRDKKMLNLNGISNTDLKLKYGAPNITRLSEYEENFTIFSIHIVSLRMAWLMRRARRPTWASPISPSISARGTRAATESTTIISMAPLRTNASTISSTRSP